MAALVQEIVLSPRSLDLISAVDSYERTLVFPSSNSFITDFRRDDFNYDYLSIDPTRNSTGHRYGLVVEDPAHRSPMEKRSPMSARTCLILAYVFMLCGAAVDWLCRLQSSTSLSSAESEFYSLSCAVAEAAYVRNMLSELGVLPDGATSCWN